MAPDTSEPTTKVEPASKAETTVPSKEKKGINTLISTPGYRLDAASGVEITPRQRQRWELALWAGTILQGKLHAQDFDSTLPYDPTDTASPNYHATEIFSTQIQPVVRIMQESAARERGGKSEIEKQEGNLDDIGTLTEMAGMAEFMVPQRTIFIDKGKEDEWEELFETWDHDIRGKAASAAGFIDILNRKNLDNPTRERIAEKARAMTVGQMRGIYKLVTEGLPFEQSSTEGEQNLFPHEDILLSDFPLIFKAVGDAVGVNFKMDVDSLYRNKTPLLPPVVWNKEWLARFVENIATNSRKAYEQMANATNRDVFVHMEIKDGNLVMILSDAAVGYSKSMLDHWDDVAHIPREATGWNNPNTPTTGIGLQEHAAILEREYGGKVSLHFSPQGGAATMIQVPLKAQ